jgi:hypothetical protein
VKTPATPLPFIACAGGVIGAQPGPDILAPMLRNLSDAEQNADYIAHAANAYPQLVAALRLLVGKFNAGEYGRHCHLMGAAQRLLTQLGE